MFSDMKLQAGTDVITEAQLDEMLQVSDFEAEDCQQEDSLLLEEELSEGSQDVPSSDWSDQTCDSKH